MTKVSKKKNYPLWGKIKFENASFFESFYLKIVELFKLRLENVIRPHSYVLQTVLEKKNHKICFSEPLFFKYLSNRLFLNKFPSLNDLGHTNHYETWG